MKPDWWPGHNHEAFTEWALDQGVIVNGVTPARFPGRGLGMIATRQIKVGDSTITQCHTAGGLTVTIFSLYRKEKQ